jgi:adenine-specific DNA methylase
MTAVVWKYPDGTYYKQVTKHDMAAYALAMDRLNSSSPALLPTEPTPLNTSHRAVGSPSIYGMSQWSDLFLPRQLVCITTFIEKIRSVALPDESLCHAVQCCLALCVSKITDYMSTLSTWRVQRTCVRGTFSRQALAFTWDFGEMNPFAESAADFREVVEYVCKAIEAIAFGTQRNSGSASVANATTHPLPDDSASALVTDPPY